MTFSTWAEAEAALTAVSGRERLPGGAHPMAVKFADAKPAELAKFEARGAARRGAPEQHAPGTPSAGGAPAPRGASVGGGGGASSGHGSSLSSGGGAGGAPASRSVSEGGGRRVRAREKETSAEGCVRAGRFWVIVQRQSHLLLPSSHPPHPPRLSRRRRR